MFFWKAEKSVPPIESVADDTNALKTDAVDNTDEELPPIAEISESAEELFDYSAVIEDFRVYLAYRIPTSFAVGGITGGISLQIFKCFAPRNVIHTHSLTDILGIAVSLCRLLCRGRYGALRLHLWVRVVLYEYLVLLRSLRHEAHQKD